MRKFMIIFESGDFEIVEAESMKDILNKHSSLWFWKVRSITRL